MTTVERWQGQLPSRLRGGEGSSTQVATQDSPDVECPEGLRHKFSNWRASVPFRSSPNITPQPAQRADPKTPQYEESDSGIGITTPSSQDDDNEPPGLELPGTELRCFDSPISDRLKARFFDIKVLYTQPLLDYILKRKKDPGDISMKLKYLGLTSLSTKLHIVIQCERKIAKRVRKFFAQGHVEEELLSDFRIFVLEKALLRLTDDEAIEVLTDSLPERTWCGTPIRLTRGNVSVMATFGGIIVVEAAQKHLFGLTAAHSLKKLHSPPSGQLLTHDREAPRSSSSSEASESESDSDCESTITTGSSVHHPEHLNGKGLDTIASQNTLEIGTILCNTFDSSMAQNYDWAIIHLNQPGILPNRVSLGGQFDSSDFEEESDLEPILFPIGNPCASVSRQVLVLKKGAKPKGEMSLDTSSVLICPGSSFVEVYDLAMEHGSSLSPGDSGSWVVDAKTSVLYGHVVSTDAFGEAQVMPIRSTLDSIKVQMNATRVFLPNREEIQLLQEGSRSRTLANLEVWLTEAREKQAATQTTHPEDMKGGQSASSPPSRDASDKSSSERALSQQDLVAQSLEIARESPDGAPYPSIRDILESALEETWAKVQDQPDSYVMTRDEFAVFNFFQHRFAGDNMAISARKRFWEAAASVDFSESTKTESGDLALIDAIRELVQALYRRVDTYGPNFANVATKLFKLEMTLRLLRYEVAEQQELPVHIQQSYTNHLHSLVEECGSRMKRVNFLLDTYHEEEISLARAEASMSSELKPVEPILAPKKMAIELHLDSIKLLVNSNRLQKRLIYDRHQSDLEEIKDKVDHIAAHLFAHWNAESFSGGEDDSWRHFQLLLEKEGFSSQVLSKKKDILMAYIKDLGYIADTTTKTLSHAHKPVMESQGTDSHGLKKSGLEHKYATSLQMDVITTEDTIALDGKNATIQQIQPALSPRESNIPRQAMSAQLRSKETSCDEDGSDLDETSPPNPSPRSIYRRKRNNHPSHSTESPQHMPPDQHGIEIADSAHWTYISHKLVSVEVLQRAGVRYEARPDYMAIPGVLSGEQVTKLVRESEATITSGPPQPYLENRSSPGQGRPVFANTDDEKISFIPLIEDDDKGKDAIRTDHRGPIKTRHSDVALYFPPRGVEKKQEKPGSRQEISYARQVNGVEIRLKRKPHREKNGQGGLQHSAGTYDKGVRGGTVGIGSAAVSLLSVLSEAAPAI